MENKRNGWAFGLGIYGGAYQLVAGLILILFCSGIGGVPYGVALILSGLACGAITFFTARHLWARVSLLLLGVAGILGVFALGFLIEMLGGFRQGSESIVLLFRVVCFNPAVATFLAGIWLFEVDGDKKKRFYASSIVAKVLILVGIALCAATSALTFWQVTNTAAFSEWLYGLFGDKNLTGSALAEAQILLRSDFIRVMNVASPILEGVGLLLIALSPAYAWYLDGEGILLGKRSKLGTLIVTVCAIPFLAVAELVLIGSFISFGSIVSLIFGIITLLALALAWFFSYAFPAIRGKRPGVLYNTEA